jgi:hypothetical protein
MKLSEQGVVTYKAMLDQLDFLKKQQWIITTNAVLIYAAISWLSKDLLSSVPARFILTAVTAITCVYSVILLCAVQRDLKDARCRVQEANEQIFELDENAALGIKKYQGPHGRWRRWQFLFAFIAVSVVGAVLLILWLWEPHE